MGRTLFTASLEQRYYFRALINKLGSSFAYSFFPFIHDFSQFTVAWWVKHSPEISTALDTRETVL